MSGSETEDARAAATRAWTRLEDRCARAFAEFPAVAAGGFHGGTADPRPFAIAAVPGWLVEADLYDPQEVDQLPGDDAFKVRTWRYIDEAVARVEDVIERFAAGGVPAEDFREAVVAAARG